MEALKLLEKKVDAALVEEQAACNVPNPKYTTPAFEASMPAVGGEASLFGFAIPVEEAEAKVRADHQARRRHLINKYRDEASELRKMLVGCGFTPMVMITKKAWDKIVLDHGLFTLMPNRVGEVSLRTGWSTELRAMPASLSWVCAATVIALWTITIALLGPALIDTAGPTPWGLFLFGSMALCLIGSLALTISLGNYYNTAVLTPKRIRAAAATLSHEQLLEKVSHERVLGSTYGEGTKVIFPPPPPEVVRLLRGFFQTPGHDTPALRVAAEAGAIRFAGGWEQVLGAAVERDRQIELAIKRDPILFVENRSAVAILAQYGPEFKLEAAAIDAVVNSEHLL